MSAASDVVRVWLIRTDLPAPVVAELATVLDDAEQQRARAINHPPNRARFVAAHGATRLILRRELGLPARHIRWSRGRNGKPELAGPAAGTQVNLSHSGGLAALAVSQHRPVGVDVQWLLGGRDPLRLATRYYPPAEADAVAAAAGEHGPAMAFGRLWTRKESCVKAAGGRLMAGLRLPVFGAEPVLVTGGAALPGPFLVRDVPVPPGYAAAVALTGRADFHVVGQDWPAGRHGDQPDDCDPMVVGGCWTDSTAPVARSA